MSPVSATLAAVRRLLLPLLAVALTACGGSAVPAHAVTATGGPRATSAPTLPPAPATPLAADVPVPSDAQDAVVVSVSDGDTVHLRGVGTGPLSRQDTRVRLLLINAPEVFSEVQCYGPEATARTTQLLPRGAQVRVQADAEARDKYGRPLLHVWTADGVEVGEELVAEGYARVLQIDPNRRYLAQFRRQEQQAKAAGRGLWGACR